MKTFYFVAAACLSTGAIKLGRQDYDIDAVSSSDGIFPGDQSDRNTQPMSELDKRREDTYHQGMFNTGTTSDTNHNSHPNYKGKKLAPSNQPKHIPKDGHAASSLAGKSKSGISNVYMTMGTEENTKRFIKLLFSKGFIAEAVVENGGFERKYLMFGQEHDVKDKLRVQMITSDARVP